MSRASVEDIKDHLHYLNKSQKEIESQIYSICKGFEGGITLNEAWGMSPTQRNRAVEFLNELAEKQEQAMKKRGKGA